MSNIIGFVLNKEDNRLIDDLREEGITSADILRTSLHYYHHSVFNNKEFYNKNIINSKKIENGDNKYIDHLKRELEIYKNKYDSLEEKLKKFVNDIFDRLDDKSVNMLISKYDLKNMVDVIEYISPEEREWLSTTKKLDELFKRKK